MAKPASTADLNHELVKVREQLRNLELGERRFVGSPSTKRDVTERRRAQYEAKEKDLLREIAAHKKRAK
jgi:hypothetical protein